MTAKVLRKCPECGKNKLERLIGTGAGIIFKGSGFYETDYKRSRASGGGAGSSEKPAEKAPEPKKDSPSKKSESKPPKKSGA